MWIFFLPNLGMGGSTPPAAAPLLITATLKAAEIATPAPASPWTIDPNRTQEIAP